MHTSNWARKQDITAFGSCCQHELGIAALDGSPAQRREKHKQHCTSPLQHAQLQRDEGSEAVKETEKPAQEKETNMSMREKQAGTHQNKKHDKETKKRTAHAQKQASNGVLRCSHRHAHTVFSCCESRKPAKCLFCVLFAGASLSLPLSSRCAGGIAAAAVAWCGLFSAAGRASAGRRGGKSRLQASLCPPVCL